MGTPDDASIPQNDEGASLPAKGAGPRLSIVVPVYNVQAYLEECLSSVLSQNFADLEVIAVDDASTDHSGEILDAWAAMDPRLRVVRMPYNVGLGPARNAGLAEAGGDYVLFLDSDDTMTPGSLSAIADRLVETGDPDMLIIDHARSYWWGKVSRNIKHQEMADLAASNFTFEDAPRILEFLQVAWNKVCRRAFLERERLWFPSGYYEDTPWTHQAYFTAASIATLPIVCILYRQRRHGSILGSASQKHFDSFDQWEAVLAFVDSRPELARWKPEVVHRMVRHHVTVLNHGSRLTAEQVPEYLARASRQLRAHGTATPTPSATVEECTHHRLVWRGDVRAYRAHQRAQERWRRMRDAVAEGRRKAWRTRNRAKNRSKQAEYRRLLNGPLDPNLVVFSSLWDRGYQGNPAAIHAAMCEHAPQLRGVWVVRPSETGNMPEGVEYVVPGTRRYWQTMAMATYFVNDVNFPDDVVKRPGQVHVQTQHGTPLKHMGLDLMAHPAASKDLVFRSLLRRSDRWDYNLSANRHSTLTWERAFPSRFTSLESGYPRNDLLVRGDEELTLRTRRDLRIEPGKTAVLFAPTHRDHDKHFIIRAELRRLAESLGDDIVLMVRAHYFYQWMPELDQLDEQGVLRNVSRYRDVEELMLASDALITDYSSIMFDYANLDRPIVLFAPDWRTYVDVRGVYFDIFDHSPGLTLTDQESVARALVSGDADGRVARKARAAFREEFCQFDDGRAAERVVRRVFLDEPDLPIVPLADRRPPRTPRLLSYPAISACPVEPETPLETVERYLAEATDPVLTGLETPARSLDPELGEPSVVSS